MHASVKGRKRKQVQVSAAPYRPEAALLGSAGPLTPPVLAGAAGLAGITALAFSSMATT